MKRKFSVRALLLMAATSLVFTGCKDKENDLSVKAITVSPSSVTLKPGQSETLSVTIFPENAANKNVSWASSASEIVSVTGDGKVVAIKEGAATITVTTEDGGEKATSTVTVTAKEMMNVGTSRGAATPVSGTWPKYTIVNMLGQIFVPEDSTLTIQEGVEVIVSADAQDNNSTKIELIVEGSLYCLGTADAQVTFTVPAGDRDRKTSGRHWGGIIGSTTCAEMLLDHVLVEYTGAITTIASPSVTKGLFKAGGGDGMVAFNTNNPSGKYVITNSTFRYTGEDAIYVQGGDCIFMHNLFYAVGDEGGEAINVKAGCVVDAAFNVMYSPNTNAFKLSNAGFGAGRELARINAYNNTIINSGWRRDPSKPKGGSVWAESGYVNVFNNLIVNCMFAAKAENYQQGSAAGTNGVTAESKIDYNFYASGTAQSSIPQHVTNGTVTAFDGFKPGRTDDVVYGAHDVRGAAAGENDPLFVSFPFLTNPVVDISYSEAWNFRLQAGSPALDASKVRPTATDGFTRYFADGITVNGTLYKSPAPAEYFGAFGQNQ